MKKLINLSVITLLAMHCTGTVSLRMRRDANAENNDSQDTGVMAILGTGLSVVESMPGVGGVVQWGVGWAGDTLNAAQDLTNGGLARVLGGAMPCIISEDGIRCTGITEDTNIATLIMEIVEQLPLPELGQKLLNMVLKATANPAATMLFGGSIIPSS